MITGDVRVEIVDRSIERVTRRALTTGETPVSRQTAMRVEKTKKESQG